MQQIKVIWSTIVLIGLYCVVLVMLPMNKKYHIRVHLLYFIFIILYAIDMNYGLISHSLLVDICAIIDLKVTIYAKPFKLYQNLISLNLLLCGLALTIIGWRQLYNNFWDKVKGSSQVIKTGLYRFIRHPQYTGMLLIALSVVTNQLNMIYILIYLMLVVLYYRLSKKEENDLIKTFNEEYIQYKKTTHMFLPFIPKRKGDN